MGINTETIEKQLDDHGVRIKRLEESDIRNQMLLSEIQKSQAELKVLVIETTKEQNKSLEKFTDKMIDTVTTVINNTVTTNNSIKLTDRKEFWGVVVALVGIVTAIVTYLVK